MAAAPASSYGGYAPSSSASLPDAPVCKDFQNGRFVARYDVFVLPARPLLKLPPAAADVCAARSAGINTRCWTQRHLPILLLRK